MIQEDEVVTAERSCFGCYAFSTVHKRVPYALVYSSSDPRSPGYEPPELHRQEIASLRNELLSLSSANVFELGSFQSPPGQSTSEAERPYET